MNIAVRYYSRSGNTKILAEEIAKTFNKSYKKGIEGFRNRSGRRLYICKEYTFRQRAWRGKKNI